MGSGSNADVCRHAGQLSFAADADDEMASARGEYLSRIDVDPSRRHHDFMREALALAATAAAAGEVPVGAVVVLDDAVVGHGFNQPIQSHDPTAHAEVVAIRDAAARRVNYRLAGATLYVTIEPCLMCVGAMIHARIDTVVFGAPEPKAGALESTQRAHEHPALNHRLTVVSGVLEGECAAIMRGFFEARRGRSAAR